MPFSSLLLIFVVYFVQQLFGSLRPFYSRFFVYIFAFIVNKRLTLSFFQGSQIKLVSELKVYHNLFLDSFLLNSVPDGNRGTRKHDFNFEIDTCGVFWSTLLNYGFICKQHLAGIFKCKANQDFQFPSLNPSYFLGHGLWIDSILTLVGKNGHFLCCSNRWISMSEGFLNESSLGNFRPSNELKTCSVSYQYWDPRCRGSTFPS